MKMTTMKEAALNFLALQRIAVAGVSRNEKSVANLIYRKLRAEGYEVFAVNPNARVVEGDFSFADLKSIPHIPDAVVIVTKPEVTDSVVRECAALGIANVWMHNGIKSLGSSVSENAVRFCRENGINAIPGGCPMMFVRNADFGHRLMCWWQTLTGKLPRKLGTDEVQGYYATQDSTQEFK